MIFQELRPFNKEIPKSEIGIEISKLPINPSIDIIITKTANSILNNFIVWKKRDLNYHNKFNKFIHRAIFSW